MEFAHASSEAIPIHILDPEGLEKFLAEAPEITRNWVGASGFTASPAKYVTVPDKSGALAQVLVGAATPPYAARNRFWLAGIAKSLPEGRYRLVGDHAPQDRDAYALGWLLSHYSFGRYKTAPAHKALLVCPDGVDRDRLLALAQGEVLTRDLINTPASDMGPTGLEAATRTLAERHGADLSVTMGEALLSENFPLIHTVGRAAADPPRLLDMRWGNRGPRLTLVGKGVCFDTGGLNIKPGASMGLMKKDMGGAATVLGLAQMIMATHMPIQLRVLIPAVENAIGGDAFRPQDILTSRKGLTVEINNTDAEGRLVLADALALADETPPDLMICMATLTGAARVALGPDLAPFYCDDPQVSQALTAAADRVADPVWQMPFHPAYEAMIEPGIADLDNAPAGGFAGSITAALFLRRFVTDSTRFVHFDIYGWQPKPQPARPKGGVGQGARALLEALPEVLDL